MYRLSSSRVWPAVIVSWRTRTNSLQSISQRKRHFAFLFLSLSLWRILRVTEALPYVTREHSTVERMLLMLNNLIHWSNFSTECSNSWKNYYYYTQHICNQKAQIFISNPLCPNVSTTYLNFLINRKFIKKYLFTHRKRKTTSSRKLLKPKKNRDDRKIHSQRHGGLIMTPVNVTLHL